MEPADSGTTTTPPVVPGSQTRWEEAYQRFETPAQEIAKFRRRLEWFGASTWPDDVVVAELFCGRGNGLVALEQLGIRRLDGVDLSMALLSRYQGRAQLHCHDCRRLPFADNSKDVIVVQGGLHHLPGFPEDLAETLGEVRRVLRQGGRFVVVEPWLTPFLRVIHCAIRVPGSRSLWGKLDALAIMIEEEKATYERWLGEPSVIHSLLQTHFHEERCRIAWGKLMFLGRKI